MTEQTQPDETQPGQPTPESTPGTGAEGYSLPVEQMRTPEPSAEPVPEPSAPGTTSGS